MCDNGQRQVLCLFIAKTKAGHSLQDAGTGQRYSGMSCLDGSDLCDLSLAIYFLDLAIFYASKHEIELAIFEHGFSERICGPSNVAATKVSCS